MAREIESPVTTKGDGHLSDTITTHPAYAQIGASRVTGHTQLYDSDFTHQHYMTISIRASELHRGLNRDYHHGRQEIIEVALSEAQWATFVSAPNMGSGVPCTIQRHNGKMVPQLPPPQERTEQFGDEVKSLLKDVSDYAETASAKIDAMGLPKGKTAELKAMFHHMSRKMEGHMPFIASQFDEHMEGSVERAKSEVHGYMTSVLHRAGLEALAAPDKLPLAITHDPR